MPQILIIKLTYYRLIKMKKILVIHNKYRQLGGEDIAVNNELLMLKKNYEVKELYFDNNKVIIFNCF